MRVTDILDALAEGISKEELIADFPYVTLEDIRACLRYAASITEESRRAAPRDEVRRRRTAVARFVRPAKRARS